MNLIPLKTKSKFFWTMLLVVLIFIVVWVIGLYLVEERIGLSGDDCAVGSDCLNKNETMAWSARQRLLDANEEQIAKISTAIITKEKTDEFIDRLLSVGDLANVNLKIDKVTETDSGLEVSLSARGSFSQTAHFLRLIEVLPYRSQITHEALISPASDTSGTYRAPGSGSSAGGWRAEINFKVLSYR